MNYSTCRDRFPYYIDHENTCQLCLAVKTNNHYYNYMIATVKYLIDY